MPEKKLYKAARLREGYQYRVKDAGEMTGEVVTVIDNTPFPDDDMERRRKITVQYNGEVGYLLPRQLEDDPIGEGLMTVQVAAPAVATLSAVQAVNAMETAQDFDQEQMVKLAESVMVRPLEGPMDPRLDHLRPSRAKARRYISRLMKNGKSDIEVLLAYTNDVNRAANDGYPVNVALKGDTQSGKTMLVHVLAVAWADALGLPKPMPVFTVQGSAGVTDFDLFGQPANLLINGVDRIVWLPGTVDLASQAGGLLYFDEINAIDQRYTTSLFSILDHRHDFTNRSKATIVGGMVMAEHVKVHQDLWIVATYNEGYEGMVKMNKAVHQRFDHILWDYDPDVERKLLELQGQADAIMDLAKALRTARKNRHINTPVGTAVLQRLQRNLEIHGLDMGMEILYGMFDARDRPVVEEIVTSQGHYTALQEEERQRMVDAGLTTTDPSVAAANLQGLLNNDPF